MADPAAAHRATHGRLSLEASDRLGYTAPSVQRSRQLEMLDRQRAVAALEQAIREHRFARSPG